MNSDDTRLVWFIQHPSARIWSVNPYKQCGIRCVYCIARSQGDAEPWFEADRVVDELRARLEQVPRDVEVFLGALADAYPAEEEHLLVTRAVLAELSRQGRPFCVNTKSNLVARDVDILAQHQGHCDVCISLCSLEQSVISRLELSAPSVSDRLEAVLALSKAGVDVNVDAAPWIPGVGDIAALVDALPAGVVVQVAPLDIRHIGPVAKLAGMTFTQEQINAAYERHREAVGGNSRVTWKDPVPCN